MYLFRPHMLLLLAALCLITRGSAQDLASPSTSTNASNSSPVAAPEAAPTGNGTGVLQDLEFLRLNALEFWARHGHDNEFGGIHGTLDRDGATIPPTSKALMQQARHIWAFSTHYLHNSTLPTAGNTTGNTTGPAANASPTAQLNSTEQLAQSTYDFVKQHMLDGNNSLWFWNVSRNGSVPIQRNKVMDGQLSVLIAFSQYFQAFGIPDARDAAITTFRILDDAWHDKTYGGYIETDANGFPQPPAAANSSSDAANSTSAGPGDSGEIFTNVANASTPPDAAGGRGLDMTGNETRSLNVLMHGTEALAALHRATNDTVVGQRLLEILDIICNRLERSKSFENPSEGLLYSEYTPAPQNGTWLHVPGQSGINYGTNLEIAWLVPDTLDFLLSINAVNRSTHQTCTRAALDIGAAAVRDAHDAENGGFYELRTADGNVSTAKVWWIQSNAMLALFKLHKNRQSASAAVPATLARVVSPAGNGSQPDYLQLLAETVWFVRQYQTDNVVAGEQFWQVEPKGTNAVTGELDKDTKGNRWKASLYITRTPLYLLKWIEADPQLSRSLANYTSRPPAAAQGTTVGATPPGRDAPAPPRQTSGVGAMARPAQGAAGLFLRLVGVACVFGLLI